MTSPWVVTTSTDRVNLDSQRRGELTFTVTNSSDAADQVVFEPVPGEGVDRSAVTVDNPGRPVPGHGSASFLVHIAIPQQAAAGRYELYGQAYSAHLAPEETLGRSGRIVFDVAAPPAPKRRPWWLLAVAGLVIVVLGVVGFLVFRPSDTAVVPNVVGQPQAAASDRLGKAGLKLGTVRRRLDAANDGKVLQQATTAGTKVAKGTGVDVVVGVNLRAPTPALPPSGGAVAAGRAQQFQWSAVPGAASYHLVVQRRVCSPVVSGDLLRGASCGFTTIFDQVVAETTATVPLPPPPTAVTIFGPTSQYQWTVNAVDDFNGAGTPTSDTPFSTQP